jgi:hypothetical protein
VAHLAAQGGDIEALKKEVSMKKEIIHAKDENGWTVRNIFVSMSAFWLSFSRMLRSVIAAA